MKKWIILGVIIFIAFIIFIATVFGNIIYTVESSIKEASEKQKKLKKIV